MRRIIGYDVYELPAAVEARLNLQPFTATIPVGPLIDRVGGPELAS
jgi:hypothetical protein